MSSNYVPLMEPGYDQSVDTAASGGSSSYMLFLPAVQAQLDFRKPIYDKKRGLVTVFRPFPCRSFSDPDNSFEPYRKDSGGRNHFGWWMKRVHVAWNVGRPATTFIVHNEKWGIFDPRLTPLATLHRAIKFAVKKGQGKASEWAQTLVRPFEPEAKTVLEWSGLTEGGDNTGAVITPPKELFLMQGMIPMLGGEVMFGPNKTIPGWGNNPTCVFGLTTGAGNTLVNLASLETPNYRGDPGNFEARYVHGDLVSPDSGRFIYVYPKGADPTQGRYQSQPIGAEILDQQAEAGGRGDGGAKARQEVGFDVRLEKDFQGLKAVMASEKHRAMMRKKWKHWDEQKDKAGQVRDPGILWYPTYVEQARILSRIIPAEALYYAFSGQHNDWLDEDTKKRAKATLTAGYQPPAAPRAAPPPPPPTDGEDDFPFNAPPDWDVNAAGNQDAALLPVAAPQAPASLTAPDQSLPPAHDFSPPDGAVEMAPENLDSLLDNVATEAESLFGPAGAAASPPLPPAVTTAGFDGPPPPTPGTPDTAARTAKSAAALAAAKNKMLGGK
jgi:hypothetical protein